MEEQSLDFTTFYDIKNITYYSSVVKAKYHYRINFWTIRVETQNLIKK